MSHTIHASCAALLTLAALAPAQATVFVPAGTAVAEGNSSIGTNWRSERRYQCIYAPALLTGLPGVIQAIVLRADGPTTQSSFQTVLTVRMSSSGVPMPAASKDTTFSANFGADAATVLSGALVTIPAATAGAGPSTTTVVVPLTTPFAPAPGQPLLIDVTFGFAAPPTLPGGYVLDLQDFPDGYWRIASSVAGRACPQPGTWTANALAYGDQVQWRYLSTAPAGLLAVFATGVSDTSIGGVPLPLPLDVLGATGCSLHTSTDAVQLQPTLASAGGSAVFGRVDTPRDPRLLGATVHAQMFVLDPAVNAAGLRASEKSTVTLSAGPDPRLAVLVHANTSPLQLQDPIEQRVWNRALVIGLQ